MKRVTAITIALAVLVFSTTASACRFGGRSWRDLAVHSDFIGVVRCTIAGGGVAEYIVESSWKGVPEGTKLRIRVLGDIPGNMFPVALVGDRVLIAASSPERRDYQYYRDALPPCWRELEFDLTTPYAQGRLRLPVPDGKFASLHIRREFGSSCTDLACLRSQLQEFLALPAEVQERRLLGETLPTSPGSPGWRTPAEQARVERLQAQVSVEDFLRAKIDIARQDPEGWQPSLESLLTRGSHRTLQFLQTLHADETPYGEDWLESMKSQVGRRPLPVPVAISIPEPPTARQIAIDRARLSLGIHLTPAYRFQALCYFDRRFAAHYLMRFESEPKRYKGYELGSNFGATCAWSAPELLAPLLDAHDPFVRVAAAVYLAFVDESKGVAALEELQAVEGDAGAWAALTLVRRGHAGAMPRALDVLAPDRNGVMREEDRETFQRRVLILASNIAAANGLPQPVTGRPRRSAHHGELMTWWEQHRTRIRYVSDPWFEELAAMRID